MSNPPFTRVRKAAYPGKYRANEGESTAQPGTRRERAEERQRVFGSTNAGEHPRGRVGRKYNVLDSTQHRRGSSMGRIKTNCIAYREGIRLFMQDLLEKRKIAVGPQNSDSYYQRPHLEDLQGARVTRWRQTWRRGGPKKRKVGRKGGSLRKSAPPVQVETETTMNKTVRHIAPHLQRNLV